jgi:hypothetical protein
LNVRALRVAVKGPSAIDDPSISAHNSHGGVREISALEER